MCLFFAGWLTLASFVSHQRKGLGNLLRHQKSPSSDVQLTDRKFIAAIRCRLRPFWEFVLNTDERFRISSGVDCLRGAESPIGTRDDPLADKRAGILCLTCRGVRNENGLSFGYSNISFDKRLA
jgi:hypothetical protein